MGEWIVATLLLGLFLTAMDRFWNEIAGWLNNTAANAVEKALGYNAKKFMQRAVATVTKIHDKLHNKTTVYTRQSALDTHIHKVMLSCTAPVYEQEEDVRKTFERENTQVNEFVYKS